MKKILISLFLLAFGGYSSYCTFVELVTYFSIEYSLDEYKMTNTTIQSMKKGSRYRYWKLKNYDDKTITRYEIEPKQWDKFKIGDTILLYYNPRWPYNYISAKDKKFQSTKAFFNTLLFGIPSIICLFSSFIGFITPKKLWDDE